jgi:hypothetical protein
MKRWKIGLAKEARQLVEIEDSRIRKSISQLALFIYGILLNITAIEGAHHLARGRATAVVLMPYIIGTLAACGLAFYFAKLIISTLHNIH